MFRSYQLTFCALCRRKTHDLTCHHLIPKTRYRKIRKSKPASNNEVIGLCSACHRFIHAMLSEKELEHTYNTIESLLTHPDIRRFVTWIRSKHPDKRVQIRRKRYCALT
jgi:hypothetical protein